MMLLVLFFVCAATSTAAHVIPLVPHHVQQQRQRQLSVLPSTTFERPHHYPRWLSPEERKLLLDDVPVAQQVAGLFQGYGVRTRIVSNHHRQELPTHLALSFFIYSLSHFPQIYIYL